MHCYCDEELLYLVRCGNEDAQIYLFERYEDYLKKWCSRFSGGLDNSIGWEDLMQVARFHLLSVFETYRVDKETSLKTYARLVLLNRLTTYVNRYSKKTKSYDIEIVSLNQTMGYDEKTMFEEIIEDPKEQYSPQTYMVVKEESCYYKTVFEEKLSILERKVMFYQRKGYSPEEIAQILCVPVRSVYNSVYRYNKKIQK